jgi:two-component system nitrogen regulation response regulator NtrX
VGVAEIRALLAGRLGGLGAGRRRVPGRRGGSLSDRLDEYEKFLLLQALEAADGSMAEAARRLQTDRANLYRRMRRLGIER